MIRRRRFISLVLLLSLIAQIVGQAVAGASVHNQSNAYNNVVSPSAQYNTDQVGPYNAFFANKKEAIHPGNGNLMVSQTDLVLPGQNGMDLALTRVYNSQQSNAYRMTTRVNSSTSSVWVPPVTEVRQVEVKPGYWVQTTIWVKLSDGYWTTVCRDVWREGRLEWGFYIDEWDYLVLYQYWVPGYYERVCETYWVPPVWVEMEHWYYVPPVYETRVVEIVPGYWLYYTDYWIETDRDTDTHLDKRHGLGLGWQWEFPTLELRDGNITFHSSGQSLTVDWNTASRFKDYPLLDLCFDNDSSTFNNGQVASRYKVVAKDGRITYFGSDGRLLGIVDRYGNRITFQHTTLNGAPVISQITDAIGRVITFTYSQSQVRVTAPDGRVWQYNLTVSTAANKPVLSSMVDPLGRTTTYSYNLADGNFSFTSKYSLNVTNTFANLVAMTYPTGGSSSYTYIKTKDNLGNDGARELYKIASRQDSFDSTIRNRATFTHSGEAWWVPDLLEPI